MTQRPNDFRRASATWQTQQHDPQKAIHGAPTLPPNNLDAVPATAPYVSAAASPEVAVPGPFGRYRLLKLLGQGGMGGVYLAYDPQLDRQVALKVPKLSDGKRDEHVERFLREARAAADLHHAHICPVFEVGQVDGTPYMTMAYIRGRTLAELIPRPPKRSSPRLAAILVRKLALALEEAHRKQVVHRDIKPGNIMVDRQGEPIIMDFGLARRVQDGNALLTQDGTILGTPAYMPPEQARGDSGACGPACDIYSLGVLMYELLTGECPFKGDTMAVLAQVLSEQPRPPSALCPGLDARLEAICLRAMAKRPQARYRSMAELAQALREYLTATASSTTAPAGGSTAHPTPLAEPALLDLLCEYERAAARPLPTYKPDAVEGEAGQGASNIAAPPRRRRALRQPEPAGFLPAWLIGCGLMAALLAAVVLLVKARHGTVKIELSDPTARVEVQVDGEAILLSGLDQPLRLVPGEHALLIQGEGFETVSQSFTVRRGENPVLRVSLQKKGQDRRAPQPAVEAEVAPEKTSSNDGPSVAHAAPQPVTGAEVGEPGQPAGPHQPMDSEPQATADAGSADPETAAGGPERQPAGEPRPRMTFAPHRWTMLDLAAGSSWPWSPDQRDSYKSLTDGVLTLDHGAMNWRDARVQDAQIQGQVKFVRGQNAGFSLRKWYAFFSPRAKGRCCFAIGSTGPHGGFQVLKETIQPYTYRGYFQLRFSAVGNRLTIHANDVLVLEAHDPSPAPDLVGINAFRAKALFKEIQIKVLDAPPPE